MTFLSNQKSLAVIDPLFKYRAAKDRIADLEAKLAIYEKQDDDRIHDLTEAKQSLRIAQLEAELTRCRTTEQAAAHALDTLRQSLGLDLIQGEHPADTGRRIRVALAEAEKREHAAFRYGYSYGLADRDCGRIDCEGQWRDYKAGRGGGE